MAEEDDQAVAVKAQIRSNPEQHCSICKDAGEGLMLCASCSTTQHASCMIEFGGCSGCGESDPLARPVKRQRGQKASAFTPPPWTLETEAEKSR